MRLLVTPVMTGDCLNDEGAVEDWLTNQVGPAYDALAENPSRALSVNDVRARLLKIDVISVARECP